MSKVLVGGKIREEGLNLLRAKGHELYVEGENSYDPEVIDAVVLRCSPFGKSQMDNFPNLKIIARHGVGVDNIDLAEAKKRGVVVTNTPEANWLAVAEHTIGEILLIRKRLLSCDRSVRNGHFGDRNISWESEMPGLKVGIVGYGRIGGAVSKMMYYGFGVSIVAYDPYKKIDDPWVVQVDSLRDLLTQSQVLSLHVPLTYETSGMIGSEELDLLPEGAVVINTARGEVLDMAALVDFLNSGRIGAASLDVFDEEPPSVNHPMMNAPNLVLSPHKAGLTQEALIRMSTGAAQSVCDYFDGIRPENIV